MQVAINDNIRYFNTLLFRVMKRQIIKSVFDIINSTFHLKIFFRWEAGFHQLVYETFSSNDFDPRTRIHRQYPLYPFGLWLITFGLPETRRAIKNSVASYEVVFEIGD